MNTNTATCVETPAAVPAVPAQGAGLAPGCASLNPEALIARAIEAGVPVEALERLLAMRAELKREGAQAAFFASLAGFQASLPAISRSKVATVTTARGSYSYRYADIADIQQAIAPALHARGLSVTFDTRHTEGGYLVACIVHHLEGHSERTEFLVPIDVQARMNDAQKAGSALTYGRRYALCAALGIVTAEDDDDARATEGRTTEGSRSGNASPPAGPPPSAPPPSALGGHPSGSAPPVRHNGAPSTQTGAEAIVLAPPRPPGEPVQWISPAQHRRLEALLQEAGLPRERVRDWLAHRHPQVYPEGVRLNRIWVRHAEEIERSIPRFVAAMKEEQLSAERARAQGVRMQATALDWVVAHYGWKGDLEELDEIVIELASRAALLQAHAEAKDGALDPTEVAEVRVLRDRAELLRGFLTAARAREDSAREAVAAMGRAEAPAQAIN